MAWKDKKQNINTELAASERMKTFDLPKTRVMWKSIIDANDSLKFSTLKDRLESEIESAKVRLSKCESMEEYHAVTEEIESLNNQLTASEIERRAQPKRAHQARHFDVPKLPGLYNEEFKPYHSRYVELDKKLKENLKKLAKDTEKIINEMTVIQNMEIHFHTMKSMGGKHSHSDYIQLPIDNQSLKKPYNFYNTLELGLVSESRTLIQQIKKLK